MHRTSFQKMVSFWETYIQPAAAGRPVKLLDIGSKVYKGHSSYKDALDLESVQYMGLDLEAGNNVDIVPNNAFVWEEIGREEIDFCISGQTFEHNPFFWITFAEVARVLKQGGTALIIAPGRGHVHRYPADCWRFFPDSWASLCSYAGLELLECLFEDGGDTIAEPSLVWCDSCVIARKPVFTSQDEADVFYERLAAITATLPATGMAGLPENKAGVCFRHYAEHNKFRCGPLRRAKAVAKRVVRALRGTL